MKAPRRAQASGNYKSSVTMHMEDPSDVEESKNMSHSVQLLWRFCKAQDIRGLA
ncbi:hypothetical protein PM082_009880 [Marasmius tenuissimus]|nr:hypothetical protein PM082_009880 [Marasmius tenuissimus]